MRYFPYGPERQNRIVGNPYEVDIGGGVQMDMYQAMSWHHPAPLSKRGIGNNVSYAKSAMS